MERMLSLQEVAGRLGLSSESVRRYIHLGLLSAYRVGSRKLVVPEAAVENYLASSKCLTPNAKELTNEQ